MPRDPVDGLVVAALADAADTPGGLGEVLAGGPVDVVTGDWTGDGGGGAFLRALTPVLPLLWEQGTRLVAATPVPAALAGEVRALAASLGLDLPVATVETERLGPAAGGTPLAGGWGVAAALDGGAQVVLTGRLDPAAPLVGAAAAHFGWRRDDWDRLAAAAAVGHVLAGGSGVTGGSYVSGGEQVAFPVHPGAPLAELLDDGAALLTKHPGTGGAVTVGTVTAQLLGAFAGVAAAAPDAVADLSGVRLERLGTDLVRLSGVQGRPPTGELDAVLPGSPAARWRAELLLTGEAGSAAELALAVLRHACPDPVVAVLARPGTPGAATVEEAAAVLRVESAAAAGLSAALREVRRSGPPGLAVRGPWPVEAARARTAVPAEDVLQVVTHAGGRREHVPHTRPGSGPARLPRPLPRPAPPPPGPARRAPLGAVVDARSRAAGDDAVLALWARDDAAAGWLLAHLTEGAVRAVLPEAGDLPVHVTRVGALRGVVVVVAGLLAPSLLRPDGWAELLGEHLRQRPLDLPEVLL